MAPSWMPGSSKQKVPTYPYFTDGPRSVPMQRSPLPPGARSVTNLAQAPDVADDYYSPPLMQRSRSSGRLRQPAAAQPQRPPIPQWPQYQPSEADTTPLQVRPPRSSSLAHQKNPKLAPVAGTALPPIAPTPAPAVATSSRVRPAQTLAQRPPTPRPEPIPVPEITSAPSPEPAGARDSSGHMVTAEEDPYDEPPEQEQPPSPAEQPDYRNYQSPHHAAYVKKQYRAGQADENIQYYAPQNPYSPNNSNPPSRSPSLTAMQENRLESEGTASAQAGSPSLALRPQSPAGVSEDLNWRADISDMRVRAEVIGELPNELLVNLRFRLHITDGDDRSHVINVRAI